MSHRLRWRKFVSHFMLTMTGLCALVAVAVYYVERLEYGFTLAVWITLAAALCAAALAGTLLAFEGH